MSWIDRCASPKQRYFHLPDERDGVQYLQNLSGQIDQLAGSIDHLGRGVTRTTKECAIII